MDFPCPLEVPSKTRQEAKISRLLTLIVVAVVYTYLHDWSTRFRSRGRRGLQRRSRSPWQLKKKLRNRDTPQSDAAQPVLVPAVGTARRGSSLADRCGQRAEQ